MYDEFVMMLLCRDNLVEKKIQIIAILE
jgi:hypothetical protein